MKKTQIIFAAFFVSLISFAQPYGNEWIDYSKVHYKFQSEHQGLMRISYETLIAIEGLTSIDLEASHFKLISGGEELPLYLTTDGVLAAGDYIEFYATPNDGKFDTQLFEEPEHQLQDKTSLFGEVRTYYLILDDSQTHLRYENTANDLSNVGTPEPYFWYESVSVTDNSYHFGEALFSAPRGILQFLPEFTEGEGWCSGIIKETINPSTGNNVGQDFKVATPMLYQGGPNEGIVKLTTLGRSDEQFVEFDKHLEISVDGISYVDEFNKGFEVNRYEFDLPITSIETVPDFTGSPQTRINCKAWNGFEEGPVMVFGEPMTDLPFESKFSVAELSLKYPRQFDFENATSFEFDLEVLTDTYVEVTNFDGGSDYILYDLTSYKRIQPVLSGGLYQFNIEAIIGTSNRSFLLINREAEGNIEAVVEIVPRSFTDMATLNPKDYLLVSNKVLEGPNNEVTAYADYRASTNGGGYAVLKVDIEDLYDQFSHGINQHPMSIKNFVNYVSHHWNSPPQYLNLLGRGVHYDKTRNNETNREASLVPTYGFAPSDWMFVNQGGFNEFETIMSVGRIPADNPEEVRAYLDKLIEYEGLTLGDDCEILASPDWTKNVLYLAQGWGGEMNISLEGQTALMPIFENSSINLVALDTLTDNSLPQQDVNNYSTQPELPNYINNGVGIINYIGRNHPAYNYLRFDLQPPSFYQNEGKYPFIVANTSYCGYKIYSPPPFFEIENEGMPQDYIKADNGGAIGFLAQGGLFYTHNTDTDGTAVNPNYPLGVEYAVDNFVNLLEPFYHNLLELNKEQSIADNIRLTFNQVYGTQDETFDALLKQYTYAGDPAVHLAAVEGRDIALTDASVVIGANEFTVSLDIEFSGAGFNGPLEIEVERVLDNGNVETVLLSVHTEEATLVEGAQNITFPIPLSPYVASANQFNIRLDPANAIAERCEQNNTESITKYLPGPSLNNQYIFNGKLFLEGPYNGNNGMDAELGDLIPLTQPYNVPPYNYNGDETLTEIPEGMVDWILVEARYGLPNISGEKGTLPISRVAALLMEDGSITNIYGDPLNLFTLTNEEALYICIRHRNHLDILSSMSIESNVFYDFSENAEKAWGSLQQKTSTDGNAFLYSSEFNSDATIQVTDYDLWFANPAALNIYAPSDANLDGTIQVSDYDLWFANKAKVGTVEIGF